MVVIWMIGLLGSTVIGIAVAIGQLRQSIVVVLTSAPSNRAVVDYLRGTTGVGLHEDTGMCD